MSEEIHWITRLFCGNWITEALGLRIKIKECKEKNTELETLNKLLDEDMGRFAEENLMLLNQVKNLTEMLAANTYVPGIKAYVNGPVKFKPFNQTMPVPIGIIADATYYVFTLDQWKLICTQVNKYTIKVLGKWTADIADCDDFALVQNGYTVGAFRKAELDHQGAFLFSRSNPHAYNVLVAHENGTDFKYYIYEPQTDQIIGEVGDPTLPDIYKTTEFWLLGAELPPS